MPSQDCCDFAVTMGMRRLCLVAALGPGVVVGQPPSDVPSLTPTIQASDLPSLLPTFFTEPDDAESQLPTFPGELSAEMETKVATIRDTCSNQVQISRCAELMTARSSPLPYV